MVESFGEASELLQFFGHLTHCHLKQRHLNALAILAISRNRSSSLNPKPLNSKPQKGCLSSVMISMIMYTHMA